MRKIKVQIEIVIETEEVSDEGVQEMLRTADVHNRISDLGQSMVDWTGEEDMHWHFRVSGTVQ